MESYVQQLLEWNETRSNLVGGATSREPAARGSSAPDADAPSRRAARSLASQLRAIPAQQSEEHPLFALDPMHLAKARPQTRTRAHRPLPRRAHAPAARSRAHRAHATPALTPGCPCP